MSNLSKAILGIIDSNETGEQLAAALTHLIEYGELEAERRGYGAGYNVGYYNGARAAREEIEEAMRNEQ